MLKKVTLITAMLFLVCCKNNPRKTQQLTSDDSVLYQEKHRPQYHFSPPTSWMNDPNGLVYNEGVYHLFYQHYPNATVWGPMHWGHATSTDLVKWEHKPIALYPDEKGAIFSGSAVVDKTNTSGFGVDGKVPLVAIYTYFSMEKEKKGEIDGQSQGIAYSLDNGETWTKFADNPVIKNPGIKDFRDPKVFWHQATKSWIMILVAGDHAKFYRSKNLKEWDNISDFGEDKGAHGGVWECPDLFPLVVEETGEEKWVLLISIGSGAPNGGSGTQYFVGDFDGTTFTAAHENFKWLDWGTDNYAGVTYNNTPDGKRKFIGWMSNWQYALKTPTTTWRSAMTLPRDLKLKKIEDEYVLVNYPVENVQSLLKNNVTTEFSMAPGESKVVEVSFLNQSKISLHTPKKDFMLTLSNSKKESLSFIYEAVENMVMVDRTNSGDTSFNYDFGNKLHYMILEDKSANPMTWELFIDASSSELFVNQGEGVMTEQLFPSEPYNKIEFKNLSNSEIVLKDFSVQEVHSVWK